MTMTIRFPHLAIICIAGLTSALASAQQKSPFTYSDMLMLDRISGLAVDPTGATALFSVRATDMEKNRGVSTLWMKDLVDPKKPEAKVPAGEGGASDVQWAADGSGFYFLSGRGEVGTTQVWKADAKGTNATQVTRLPLDVQTYRVAPDDSGVVVALAVFPDCPTLTCTSERLEGEPNGKATGQVYDRIFMRHWDTWKDGTRNHLYYVSLSNTNAQPVPLMPGFDGDCPTMPFGGNEDFAIGKGIEQREVTDQEILERLLYPMVNEGAKILEEKIAIRGSDIDVVWVNGYGWPVYRGGPMHWTMLP